MIHAPGVRLHCNPWPDTLPDGVLLQILMTTACKGAEWLAAGIRTKEIPPAKNSFGAVLLDPTRTQPGGTPIDMVLATIILGLDGRKFLPNALAKADAHDRHGMPNAVLVGGHNHLLADSDFAWGESVSCKEMIGGGSGLSAEQDGDLVLIMLEHFVEAVVSRRSLWLQQQRRLGSHDWFNQANLPPDKYADILNKVPIAVPDFDGPVGQYRDASLTAGSNTVDFVSKPPPN